jgi:hypothetical protein
LLGQQASNFVRLISPMKKRQPSPTLEHDWPLHRTRRKLTDVGHDFN